MIFHLNSIQDAIGSDEKMTWIVVTSRDEL